MADENDWIDIKETCVEVGGREKPVHPSTVYRAVKRGLLPKPVAITPGIIRWNRAEIRAARAARIAERDRAA